MYASWQLRSLEVKKNLAFMVRILTVVCAFHGSSLRFLAFQALNLFTSPCISSSSFCPKHLIIELELEICLLSFVSICEFDSEVRSRP